MTTARPGFTYRADIDGLRAVAVASVILFHAFPELVRGGFIGVDVFFVISGYVIAGVSLSERDRGTFSVANFYRRRARRILPALVVVLGACMLAGAASLFNVEYLRLAKHVLAGALGFANISLYFDSGYFAFSSETNPLLHLWSLGVEEQFYFLLPAVLLVFRGNRGLLWALAMLLGGSLFLSADPLRLFGAEAKFYFPWFRGWELMSGALLAYAAARRPAGAVLARANSMKALWKEALPAAGLLVILAGCFWLRPTNSTFRAGVVAVFGSLLVIGAGPDAWLNRRVLANKAVVFVGLISYPLYLWHWPLISFSNILTPELGAAAKSGLIAASIALATLTWAFVERPIRSGAVRFGSPPRLVAATAVMALVAGGVVWANGRVGFAPPAIDRLAFQITEPPDPRCRDRYGKDLGEEAVVDCSSPSAVAPARVALVGDSHAYHLHAGVKKYYSRRHEDIVTWAVTGCALFPEPPESARCTEAYRKVFDRIAATDSIRTVVLSEYVPFMRTMNRPHWEHEAASRLSRLIAQGKKVILVADVPSLGFDPRLRCYGRPFMAAASAEDMLARCALPKSRYEWNVVEYRGKIAQLVRAVPGVLVFDSASRLCDEKACHAMVDGRVIYRDENHLNHFGSEYLARFFDWEHGNPAPE